MQTEGLKLGEEQKCFAQVGETEMHPFQLGKQLVDSSQLGEQLRHSCHPSLRHFFQCCGGILPFPCVLQELL